MADQIKLRGGTTSESMNFTGAEREVTVDTTLHGLRVHDGVTPGGHLLGGTGANDDSELALINPGTYSAGCNVTAGNDITVQSQLNEWVTDAIKTIDDELCDVQSDLTKVSADLAVLDGRVDGHDTQIAALEANIVAINGNIDDINTQLLSIEAEVETNQNNIDDLSDRVATIEAALTAINTDLAEIKSDITKLETAVGDLEVAVAELELRVKANEDAIAALDPFDPSSLEADVAANTLQIGLNKDNIEDNAKDIAENKAAIDALVPFDPSDLEADITANATAITGLQADLATAETNITGLQTTTAAITARIDALTLNDLTDVSAAPINGQLLTYRDGKWGAENNPFVEAPAHIMGVIDTTSENAPSANAGDTYIQHRADETDGTVAGSWTGIGGEPINEGQYVIKGNDSAWHKGKTVEDVTMVQSNWTETDNSSAAFIKNVPSTFPPSTHGHDYSEITGKPAEFPPATHGHDYSEITGKPSEFPPAAHVHAYSEITGTPDLSGYATKTEVSTVDAKADTNTTSISNLADVARTGSYNDLTDKPTIGNGILTIKNSDGSTAGSFAANQTTGTNITLPAGFSGEWNDINNKPIDFPPSAHGHAWGEITGKPCLYECNTYIGSLTELP